MDGFNREQLQEASLTLISMIHKVEETKDKFVQGTSQHSLQKNRLKSLKISLSLISAELIENKLYDEYCQEDLKNAIAPISSLISKSEKAQNKLIAGSWQHAMLSRNLQALNIANPLLLKALETIKK